jgi:hypothetical protein
METLQQQLGGQEPQFAQTVHLEELGVIVHIATIGLG